MDKTLTFNVKALAAAYPQAVVALERRHVLSKVWRSVSI